MSALHARATRLVARHAPWSQMLMLALAYAAVAYASANLLSFPPVYVSPIWPAAGLAGGVLLVAGLRLWPGVAAGQMLFYVIHYGLEAPLATALALCLALAVGPTAQAALAAWLARPYQEAVTFGREAAIFRTLALAGPLACLTSSSLSVAAYWWYGAIPTELVESTWLIWWVGDSVGVLLFSALAMLAMPSVRRVWRGRVWQIALPLLGASAILTAGLSWFHNTEAASSQSTLERQAGFTQELMAERFAGLVDATVATARLFSASDEVTSGEFANFAAGVAAEGIRWLAWVPRTAGRAGSRSSKPASGDGLGWSVPLDGVRRPAVAPAGGEYFVARYVAPRDGIQALLGRGLLSQPGGAEALRVARDRGRPVIADAAGLVHGVGPIVIVPVYGGAVDGVALSVAQRRATLRGFVAGVIDLAAMHDIVAGSSTLHHLVFSLTDVTPGKPAQVLIAAASEGQAAAADRAPIWSLESDFFGRTWRWEARVSDSPWQAGQSDTSRLFLVSALVCAFLFSLFVQSSAGRSRATGLEVRARTAELSDSNLKLAAAMDIAKVVQWELDMVSRALIVDDRYLALMGTTAEREGGHRMPIEVWLREFVHPGDVDALEDRIFCLPSPEQACSVTADTMEYRQVRRDGDVRHVVARFDVARNEHGKVTRVLGVTQDISDLKVAEQRLLASERYNRGIVESSQDCIKVLDVDGRLLDMTAKGREIMCVEDFGALRGQDWLSFWKRPKDRHAASTALDAARAGRSARFRGHTPTLDGTPKWWDVVVAPVMGEDGRPVRLLGVSRDITAEVTAKHALEHAYAELEDEVARRTRELAASEQQLRAIFEVAAVGIAHVDVEGRLIKANPRFCEITGYSEQEMQSMDLGKLTHADDRAREQRDIARLLRAEVSTYTNESRYVRKGGDTVWVRNTSSTVRDCAGAPQYRIAVVDDISQTRRERELREASEQRYREMYEKNPMPMWTYDVQTLAFTSVNQAAISHYGYSRAEFLGMTLKDIRPREDGQWLEGQVAKLPPGLNHLPSVRHLKRDGTRITVSLTSHELDIDGVANRLILANDITERVRNEALMEGQNAVLESIAAGKPLQATLEFIARLAESHSPELLCSIMVAQDSGARLRCIAAPSLPAGFTDAVDGIEVGEGIAVCGTAAFRRRTVVVEDVAVDPLCAPYRELALSYGLRSCTSVPIADPRGGVLGTFAVYGRLARPLSAESETMIATLTHTAAVAIEKQHERVAREESDARFRAMFDNSPLGILLIDEGGRVLAANPRQSEITGYPHDELLAHTIHELSHPEEAARDIAQLEQVWRGERPSYSLEKRAIHKDGTQYWVKVSGAAVRGGDGQALYSVRIVEDITARIDNERALRRSEDRARATFELAALGIWHMDRDGRYLRANRSFCAMSGYTEDELRALRSEDLTFGDDRPALEMQNRRLWNGEISSYTLECRIVHRSGGTLWTNATVSMVRDEQGEGDYAIGIIEDIEPRKRAEEALYRQEEVNRLLLENLSEGVVACDVDGNLMLFNKVARDWHGTDPRKLPQQQWSQHYDLFEFDGVTPLLTERIPLVRAFSGETVVDAEMCIARKGQPARSLLASGAPLFDSAGNKVGAVVIMHDITERQRTLQELEDFAGALTAANATIESDRAHLAERVEERTRELTRMNTELAQARDAAEAASRAKSAFLATVSHEIRTPMNGVLGAMELLERAGLDGERAVLLGTAQSSARSLLGLLNDLLDMAKIEAGRIEVVPRPASLQAIADQVISTYLPNAIHKGITLNCDTEALAAPWVAVDELRLRQILGNFLSNAIKFTTVGGVDIRIASEPLGEDAQRVTFTIKDSGVGIPPDALGKLFQPFEQGVAEIARRSGGTGLGLAICRGLAERMGGTVSLESECGVGTTARLQLVLDTAPAQDTGSDAEGEVEAKLIADYIQERQRSAATDRVLVVDDHPVNRRLMLVQLEQFGIAAEQASDGVQALEMLRRSEYSLVISDCEMPLMDGFELAGALRREGGRLSRIPIIACTAHALPEVSERCRTAGMNEVLTKPVDLVHLGRALRRLLPGGSVGVEAAPADEDSPGEPVLDGAQIRMISGGDTAVEAELFDELRTHMEQTLAELDEALAGHGSGSCESLTHRSKGACLALGARPLACALGRLETAARERAPSETLDRLLRAVRREWARFDRCARTRSQHAA